MASELRRSFKQKAKDAFGLPFRFRMRLENVDSEDSGSKVCRGEPPEEFSTRSASFDFGYFSPNAHGSGDTKAQLATEPTVAESLGEEFVMIETQNKKVKNSEKSKSLVQPKGTFPHTVSSTDTLASIAARFETTTSELKAVNRLMSNMVFPGKIIYIPDKDYVPSAQDLRLGTSPPSILDVPLQESEKEDQCTLPSDVPDEESSKLGSISMPDPDLLLTGVRPILSVARQTLPADASSDVAKENRGHLDEQFIKLNVDRIVCELDEIVGGILMITPAAVMFESNSSDDVGHDSYNVIIPMAVIVGVLITEGHPIPKSSPRDASLTFEDDVFSSKAESHSMSTGTLKTADAASNQTLQRERIPTDHKTSDTSAGKTNKATNDDITAVADAYFLQDKVVADVSSSPKGRLPLPDIISCGNSAIAPGKTHPSELDRPDLGSDQERLHVAAAAAAGDGDDRETEIISVKALQSDGAYENKKPDLLTKASETDDKMAEACDKSKETCRIKPDSMKEQKQNTGLTDTKPDNAEFKSLTDVDAVAAKPKPKELPSETVAESPGKRCTDFVGNIFRFHSSSSSPDPSPSKVVDKAIDAAPDKEAESSSLPTHRLMSKTLESFSSYSRPLVDLSNSLFSRSGSDSKSPKQDEEKPDVSSFPKFDASKEKDSCSDPVPCQRMFFLRPFDRFARKNRDSATESTQENIPPEEKPTTVSESTEPEKVCLCLKIAKSIDWSALADCPPESLCFNTRLKQEYWFKIPSNRVDHLYSFFLQWTPNLSGNFYEINMEDKGFVVISDADGSFGFITVDEATKQNASSQSNKEWEIINAKEVRRMINDAEIESLPLPELSETSAIMDQNHIRQLCFHLLPRAEGSSWKLAYSSERNGFSLKTLYRSMARVDSPILLIIKDDSNIVFGAMLPCALKMSDCFYGSGESYLFSFHPNFMKYAWTGNNNYFIKGNAESLSVGAGEGVYGLWLDGDLYHGRTQPCQTYCNELLTVAEDFVVRCLEVWKFI